MEYLDTLSLTENLIDKIFVLASLKLSSVIKKKKKIDGVFGARLASSLYHW